MLLVSFPNQPVSYGGAYGIRTRRLMRAKHALSQMS
jgi:hypothetical protein